MDGPLLVTLTGLALLDSTSFGTLVIPLWMMLSPKLRLSRLVSYLLTVAGFYYGLGVVLYSGASAAQAALDDLAGSETVVWGQLAVGIVLFAWSLVYDPKRLAARRTRRGKPARVSTWRERVTGADASLGGVIGLGLAAAGLEVLTMVPYLAAIGAMAAGDLALSQGVLVLLAYVVVMVLPALLLVAMRIMASRWVTPWLERLSGWMTRHSREALAWVLGIVGFLLASDAITRLGPAAG